MNFLPILAVSIQVASGAGLLPLSYGSLSGTDEESIFDISPRLNNTLLLFDEFRTFDNIDDDGNGCLSLDEFTSQFKPLLSWVPFDIKTMFVVIDLDGNGCVTPNNHESFIYVQIERMIYLSLDATNKDSCGPTGEWWDIDGDGCYSWEEHMELMASQDCGRHGQEICAELVTEWKKRRTNYLNFTFNDIDVNSNVCLDWNEVKAAKAFRIYKEDFDQADSDGDGCVSSQEWLDSWKDQDLDKMMDNWIRVFHPLSFY